MGAIARVPIGPLTPKDIKRLLEELPARDRAALNWASTGVKQAIALLHRGRLTEATIAKATARYAAAMRPIYELEMTMLARAPAAYGRAVQERVQELGPRVNEYLGVGEHAARLARTLSAMFIVGALAMRHLAAHPEQSGRFTQQALDVDVASPEGAGLRASVLVTAVLDALDRGIPARRVRALIERADLEGSVIANLLAEIPGVPISVPGYNVDSNAPPPFRTEFARQLWRLRQRVIKEAGGTLTEAEVRAEVAARRGGVRSEC